MNKENVYIYAMKYYLSIKKYEILSFLDNFVGGAVLGFELRTSCLSGKYSVT
jgi:hypothetical protein